MDNSNSEEKAGSSSPVTLSRSQKLEHLTGRKESVNLIETLLHPETPEQALKNGKKIESIDKMKKVFGERPDTTDIK